MRVSRVQTSSQDQLVEPLKLIESCRRRSLPFCQRLTISRVISRVGESGAEQSPKSRTTAGLFSLFLFLSTRISSERMRKKGTRRDKSALRNAALRSRGARFSRSRIGLCESVEARRGVSPRPSLLLPPVKPPTSDIHRVCRRTCEKTVAYKS